MNSFPKIIDEYYGEGALYQHVIFCGMKIAIFFSAYINK